MIDRYELAIQVVTAYASALTAYVVVPQVALRILIVAAVAGFIDMVAIFSIAAAIVGVTSTVSIGMALGCILAVFLALILTPTLDLLRQRFR